jgi:hypothetical protein
VEKKIRNQHQTDVRNMYSWLEICTLYFFYLHLYIYWPIRYKKYTVNSL